MDSGENAEYVPDNTQSRSRRAERSLRYKPASEIIRLSRIEDDSCSHVLSPFSQCAETRTKIRSLFGLTKMFLDRVDTLSQLGVRVFRIEKQARDMGIPKRRLYDVLGVLRSLGLMRKKIGSHYTWGGYDAMKELIRDEIVSVSMQKHAEDTFAEGWAVGLRQTVTLDGLARFLVACIAEGMFTTSDPMIHIRMSIESALELYLDALPINFKAVMRRVYDVMTVLDVVAGYSSFAPAPEEPEPPVVFSVIVHPPSPPLLETCTLTEDGSSLEMDCGCDDGALSYPYEMPEFAFQTTSVDTLGELFPLFA